MVATPDLTVVVPTYNRAGLLADVLADLDRQDAVAGSYEVVVVDDGSTDATAATVAGFRPTRFSLRAIRQDNAGLNAARNAGADAAASEILAYLDDDVFVSPGYVRHLVQVFRDHPEAGAAAGQVDLAFEGDRPRWLTPALEGYLSRFDARARAQYLEPPDYPRGANFGVRRSVWAGLGGFLVGLDRQGRSLLSNGELEFFARFHRAGGRTVNCPEAAVVHRVPPDRLTLDWFRRRADAQGKSDVLFERMTDGPAPRLPLAREACRAGRAAPILAKNVLAGRGRASAAVWLSYCAGRVATIRSFHRETVTE